MSTPTVSYLPPPLKFCTFMYTAKAKHTSSLSNFFLSLFPLVQASNTANAVLISKRFQNVPSIFAFDGRFCVSLLGDISRCRSSSAYRWQRRWRTNDARAAGFLPPGALSQRYSFSGRGGFHSMLLLAESRLLHCRFGRKDTTIGDTWSLQLYVGLRNFVFRMWKVLKGIMKIYAPRRSVLFTQTTFVNSMALCMYICAL